MLSHVPSNKKLLLCRPGMSGILWLSLLVLACMGMVPARAETTNPSFSLISSASFKNLSSNGLLYNGVSDNSGSRVPLKGNETEGDTLAVHLNQTAGTGAAPSKWQIDLETPKPPARRSLLYGREHRPEGGYLLYGLYQGDTVKLTTELGDIRLEGTQNTLHGLARKGGKMAVHYNGVVLSTFAATNNHSLTTEEGEVIGAATNDYMVGAAGEFSLFNKGLQVKTMYMSSGETSRSLSPSAEGGGERRGDVLAFVTRIDPFQQRLVAETEIDFSEYTEDHGAPAERDQALRVKVGGISGIYNYEAVYEYVGPEYQITKRVGPMRDREGFSFKTGANLSDHSVSVFLSRYNDNIRKEQEQPRYFTYQGGLNYSFKRFKSLPVTLSYQKSLLDGEQLGSQEPLKNMETDSISGKVNYIHGSWNLALSSRYFLQNDLSALSEDSSSSTYTFAPSFRSGPLSMHPSFSFNRYRFFPTGVATDTYTANLSLKTDKLFTRRLACEIAGTVKSQRATDASIKQDHYSASFGISYLLKKLFLGIDKPSIGLQASFNKKNNWRSGLHQDDFLLMFVFSSL